MRRSSQFIAGGSWQLHVFFAGSPEVKVTVTAIVVIVVNVVRVVEEIGEGIFVEREIERER